MSYATLMTRGNMVRAVNPTAILHITKVSGATEKLSIFSFSGYFNCWAYNEVNYRNTVVNFYISPILKI